uniref:NADH:ubiquinone oxidoreductase subunit B8 n=1 Tax=Theropithecus gelada TaxID=9565 RepID=A0A8D2FPJ6_THEGE
MAVARAGVLGVQWLQRASRNVVPLGARTASRMTKDMFPGPYPRTPEERAAAAKKYNMRVEDYEPYPDEGMGDQSSILTIICTWNEAAIPPKNLSRWFTMRSEEASWAFVS